MKKQFIVLGALLALLLALTAFCGYKIISELKEVSDAEKASMEYIYLAPDFSGDSYEDIYSAFMPRLKELKIINGNAVGWIYIPNTSINYPLLQAADNDFYLNHSVSGGYSAAGAVFFDKDAPSSDNKIIYGHNMGMRSEIMFHDITKFENQDFFEQNKTGYIITEDGITELEIAAFSKTKPESGFYESGLSLDYVKENALLYREPNSEGTLYTLSTCGYSYENERDILTCVGDMVFKP